MLLRLLNLWRGSFSLFLYHCWLDDFLGTWGCDWSRYYGFCLRWFVWLFFKQCWWSRSYLFTRWNYIRRRLGLHHLSKVRDLIRSRTIEKRTRITCLLLLAARFLCLALVHCWSFTRSKGASNPSISIVVRVGVSQNKAVF